MAAKGNAFTSELRRLLNTMARTAHLSYAHHRLAVRVAGDLTAQRQGTRKKLDLVGIGTILTVPLWHEARKTFSRFGETEHEGEGYARLLQEVEWRSQAQLLVGIHEAVERLIKRIAPHYFFAQRQALAEDDCVIPFRRKEFHKYATVRSKTWRNTIGTLVYYENYVAWLAARDCKVLLADLTKGLVDFKKAQIVWKHGDALEWLRLIEFCRHCIVHNEGAYDTERRKEFSRPIQAILKKITRKSIIDEAEMILPDHETVMHAVEGMSGLGALLYRSLSVSCGMTLDFPEPGTTWSMK